MKTKLCIYFLMAIGLLLTGCDDDDINVFEKTADERAAEAIATLKADLVAPANGWRMKYRPVEDAGSYFVLMDFDEDNKVTIKTDLGAEGGAYFEQTITYRIDNSLGLELIFENYSFFAFLFEQDQATFGAEYEFDFINKTPDNTLVFTSKTDVSTPTLLVFEEASGSDENLLGFTLAQNLDTLASDLDIFSSSLKLIYENKDLIFYASLDEFKRIIEVSMVSRKSDTQVSQALDFTSGYLIKGDSMIFDSRLQGFFQGQPFSIKSILFNDLTEGVINVCTDSIAYHSYSGVTSQNDIIKLETSLANASGASFAQLSDFYFSPLDFIINNGESAAPDIIQDVAGALEMHLYYGLPLNDGTTLYGIGFVIENNDGSITFALREFTPVLTENNIVFNFEPDITLFGNQQTDANLGNINIYLDALTQGNTTYVFKFAEDLYEFHNPCTGWSFVFVNAN